MNKPVHGHSPRAARASVPGSQRRLPAALRTPWPHGPDLFSDRDEDAVERAALLREFESARAQTLELERYS